MSFNRLLLVRPSKRTGLGFALPLIPIGLEYVAASVEDLSDVLMIDMALEKRPFEDFMDDFRPDLVGVTMSATEHWAGVKIAEIAKKRGVSTVLGGYHPTAIPDELLSSPSVDMVVRGEGELTMRELLRRGSPKGVLGISYKEDTVIIHNPDRPLVRDLDSLPFPARHLRRHTYVNRLAWGGLADQIHTSRGCPGVCSFCCEPRMSGSCWRGRSPENVLKELLQICQGKNMSILIGDPHFMHDPKRVDRMCDLLQENEIHANFTVMVRPDAVAKYPQTIKRMCECGIIAYEIGIESPNQKDLKGTKKGLSIETQRRAVSILQKNRADSMGTFVIGLPTQTEEEIMQFPLYAKEIGLTTAAFGIATPFPRTEFYDDLKKRNLIFETDWSKYDEMHSVYRLANITKDRIEELATYCMGKFWTLDTFLEKTRICNGNNDRQPLLKEFLTGALSGLEFLRNAGYGVQEEKLGRHVKIFLEANTDPCVEEYTRRVGLHNILEMSNYLKILGSQLIQFTVTYDGVPLASIIVETTSRTVEYVKVIKGKEANVPLSFSLELNKTNFMEGDISNKGLHERIKFLSSAVREAYFLARQWLSLLHRYKSKAAFSSMRLALFVCVLIIDLAIFNLQRQQTQRLRGIWG